MENNDKVFDSRDKYDFKDADQTILSTGKGLNAEVVAKISEYKHEPEWMKEIRLNALKEFENHHLPSFGPDLKFLNYQDYTYFNRVSDKVSQTWEEVPQDIKNTFNKLGIPEAEHKFLAGVTTQYESEAVYHNMLSELTEKGVIFLDTDTALKQYPELFKKYFGNKIPTPEEYIYIITKKTTFRIWS